jgi:hypothetical protein
MSALPAIERELRARARRKSTFWLRVVAALPLLDLGVAQLLVLPGEAYVEYQLAAQRMRPDSFVVVAGYGEAATGYIPTEKHFEEKDPNLGDWCWVAPGCEDRMLAGLRQALTPRTP